MEKIIEYLTMFLCALTILMGLAFVLDLVWGFTESWILFKLFLTSLIFTTIVVYLYNALEL
jgi:hypothetical protein